MSRKKSKAAQKPQFHLQDFWAEKKPVLIFLGGVILLMAIFYAFWITDFFRINVLQPVVHANAFMAQKILQLVGFNVSAAGADLISTDTDFSVSIKQGCDALEPVAIFAFAVLLFPVNVKTKIAGVLIGIPLLLLLNQLRIISLYLFGIYSPTLFEFMHIQGWQVLFILITLVFLIYWIFWALQKEKSMTAAP